MDDEYEVQHVKVEGYLEKKFRLRVCSWWRKYWFVLEGKTLLCFKTKEESDNYFQKQDSRKAFLSFTNVHAVRRVYNSNPNRFVFEIVTKGPIFYLAASDEETCKTWVEALQNALQLPTVSPPLKNFRKQLLKSGSVRAIGIPSRQDYSLSQPNLHHLVERKSSVASFGNNGNKSNSFCMYAPEVPVENNANRRLGHLTKPGVTVSEYERGDALVTNQSEKDGNLLLRNKRGIAGQFLTVTRDTKLWRNTASEFFLNEQNRDWPGLSLDLYDEILDEIMLQHKEGQPKLPVDDVQTDKNTQTDFPEEDQLAYLEQVQEVRNELISYLSSTSLNRIVADSRPTTLLEKHQRPASSLD